MHSKMTHTARAELANVICRLSRGDRQGEAQDPGRVRRDNRLSREVSDQRAERRANHEAAADTQSPFAL